MLKDLNWLQVGAAYPPPQEKARMARYRDNQRLFEGMQETVYKETLSRLRRIELEVDEMGRQAVKEVVKSYIIVFNFHKRLSTLWADMLVGEPPRIAPADAKNEDQKAQIERLKRRGRLFIELYKATLDVSRFGDGILVLGLDGKAYIKAGSPLTWYPITDKNDFTSFSEHVLIEEFDEIDPVTGKATVKKARARIYSRGRISYWLLTIRDGKISEVVIERDDELTNVDTPLVIPIHNLLTTDRTTGMDDYEDIDTLVSEIMVRISQLSRVFDEHSDPAITGDDSLLSVDTNTGLAYFNTKKKFYTVPPEGKPPAYLVWDAQCQAQKDHIDRLMEQLFLVSETSPAAFGQFKQGLVDNASALRRLMMVVLKKVERLRLFVNPSVEDALILASQLEVKNNVAESVALEDVSIDWQDGLPVDETENAENESKLKLAGLTSTRTSVARIRSLEGEALEEELEEIKKEAEAAMVTEPEIPPKQDPPDDGGDDD